MPEFIRKSRINAPAGAVFAWHERPDALSKLVPPWEPVKIEQLPPSLRDGARAVLRVGPWPLRILWIAEHDDYQNHGPRGGAFTDTQVRGPMKRWKHRHIVTPDGPESSILTDHIQYELPLGILGRLAGNWLVQRKLNRMFDHRHQVLKDDLESATSAVQSPHPDQPGGGGGGGHPI